jgi:23S rRNA (cytidine1920-2'-O)/16S rRNA (cytidine1409-2'-O)-methyltransferase
MSKKLRLDLLLVERGIAETRNKAAQMIESGLVSGSHGNKLLKPGQNFAGDISLQIDEYEQWVSRAAIKLAHALNYWQIEVRNKTYLDLGASTGGFCQVLLKSGAAKIYAVEVGHGQMHKTIAENPRVILLEKTNCRDLTRKIIPEAIDLITCDVSFISLAKALPAALKLGGELIALIKPQFEVGRENIKEGIVRDEKLHKQSCEQVSNWLSEQNWLVCGIIESPIQGTSGNKEFLIHAKKL